MKQLTSAWKQRARDLKIQIYALYLAYQHPRVPLPAKIFAGCVVAYAFSPIDLIPDFVPIIGYLDDLIIVPLGIAIALKMIPTDILAECQAQSRELMKLGKPVNWAAAAIIILIWFASAVLATRFLLGLVAD